MNKYYYISSVAILISFASSNILASNFNLPPGFDGLDTNQVNMSLVTIFPPAIFKNQDQASSESETTAIASVTPPQSLQLWATKEHYRSGEPFKFSVKTNEGCYLTLINEGMSGKTTVLFPNRDRPNNWIEASKVYTVPGNEILPIAALKANRPNTVINEFETIHAICRSTESPVFNTKYDFNKAAFKKFGLQQDWKTNVTNAHSDQELTATLNITIE